MSAIGGIADFEKRSIDFSQLYRMKLAMSMRGRVRSSAYLGGSVNIIHNDDGFCDSYEYEDRQPAIFERFGSEFVVATDSDSLNSSSVFEAYRLDGLDFLGALPDGFALCQFDGEKNILILARDKKGSKPLFYKLHRGKIYFSSEIKGISEAIGERLVVEREMLSLHLTAPIGVYNACDIFRDICEVMPGECVIFGELGISRFKYGARARIDNLKAKKRGEQNKSEIFSPYPTNIDQSLDDVLADALISFDYPQFDADMPSLCTLFDLARRRGKSSISFEDRLRRQSFSYAREREDRLGAFYGIRAKGRYCAAQPEYTVEARQKLRAYLGEKFWSLAEHQKSVLEKILGERKLDCLKQRFDGIPQKEKDTDAEIRILGMLIQTVMWTESRRLVISGRSEQVFNHGFQ